MSNLGSVKTPLTPDQVVSGYVEFNSWNYYNYNSNSDGNLVIYVNHTDSGGDCDLYVRAGQTPTRFNYGEFITKPFIYIVVDYQDLSTATFFTLSINDPGSEQWYIGVYGWTTCDYDIWVDETG